MSAKRKLNRSDNKVKEARTKTKRDKVVEDIKAKYEKKFLEEFVNNSDEVPATSVSKEQLKMADDIIKKLIRGM